jgi:hypothetical protein
MADSRGASLGPRRARAASLTCGTEWHMLVAKITFRTDRAADVASPCGKPGGGSDAEFHHVCLL